MKNAIIALLLAITFIGCASGAGYELRTPDQRFNKLEAIAQQYVLLAYPVEPLPEFPNALQTQLWERRVNKRADAIDRVQMGLSIYSAFVRARHGDGVYDDEIDLRVVAIRLASERLESGDIIPLKELDRLRGTLTFLDILGVQGISPYMELLGAKSVSAITEEIEEEPAN